MSLEEELKALIGLKVVKTEYDAPHHTLYFEDGTEVSFHPHETYVCKSE